MAPGYLFLVQRSIRWFGGNGWVNSKLGIQGGIQTKFDNIFHRAIQDSTENVNGMCGYLGILF